MILKKIIPTSLWICFSLMFVMATATSGQQTIRIGMCADVHLPTMHDSEFRIRTFIDSMIAESPEFIIELGDFGTPDPKYAGFFKIWNDFPGVKYHVIGNHETDGGYSLEEALAYRIMDSPFYSFDRNGFHFIVLNGNDKKEVHLKGYQQYIGEKQQEWLKKDLAGARFPVVIFSHQGLNRLKGAGEYYGVENYTEIREIMENHNQRNPGEKVIVCFNGHSHYDHAEEIGGIWYVTINSMSYHWMGETYTQIRYSEEVDRNFKWIKYTAPYREPLFTVVEISKEGYIRIRGRKTVWEGPSPWELGYPERLRTYVRPEISNRLLKFNLP